MSLLALAGYAALVVILILDYRRRCRRHPRRAFGFVEGGPVASGFLTINEWRSVQKWVSAIDGLAEVTRNIPAPGPTGPHPGRMDERGKYPKGSGR